jgi:hypothetical protein
LAPPELAPRLQSLPPILHKQFLVAVASCSKGSWGLSVLPRVNCIGTAISISLSPWSRQRGSRYAFRAGRNLPDKEFRYLRTVIVTAAVYRGFGSSLWPCGLTNHLNLPAPGRSQTLYVHLTCLQSPVFLLNSRYRHLSATRVRFRSKSLHDFRPTFFRSYGGRLQSSLTRVLSSALGFSPRPPESVCGTDTSLAPRGDFLGSMGSRTSGLAATSSPLGVMDSRFYPTSPSYRLEPPRPSGGCAALLRPPSLQRQRGGTGILTCHPSSTPFGLDLGSD